MSAGVSPATARLAQSGMLVVLALLALALAPLHGAGWWPGPPPGARGWVAGLVAATWAGASLAVLLRARAVARRRAAALSAEGDIDAGDWLVVHASQTGQAVDIARRTADALAASGLPVRIRDIATLDAAALAAARQVLFVASTTGEGDPPDAAAGFVRDVMATDVRLPSLRYALLALGDRGYRRFCAFGHALDGWLRHAGATALFDLVEVDNGDPAALRHWQHLLGVAAGATGLPDWAPVACEDWILAGRRVLNAGSTGAPVFELRLRPPSGSAAQWRAGDIAEIAPRQAPVAVTAFLDATGLPGPARVRRPDGDHRLADLLARSHLPGPADVHGRDAQAVAASLQPLPSREYSIASVAAEGEVRLLLRRMLRPDGTPGVGSGWLCDHAPTGGTIAMRVRANPGFHGPPPEVPMILIGNGTGIAGLRAHLAERVAVAGARSWLLFGERHADHDFHQHEDILAWLAAGRLERLDLAFSRTTAGSGLAADDLATGRAAVHEGHVQDALRREAARLRAWADAGAVLLVCGSLQGMAPGVDAVLREVLGDGRVDDLLAARRYRRDVY